MDDDKNPQFSNTFMQRLGSRIQLLNPWKRNIHDGALATASRSIAKGGDKAMNMHHKFFIQPVFNDPVVEGAYGTYILNEMSIGTAIMLVLGVVFTLIYLQDDMDDPVATNYVDRLASRGSVLIVFAFWGLLFYVQYMLPATLVLWLRALLEVSLSILLHVRQYYEADYVTYVRSVGIWSVALKAIVMCYEIGFSHFSFLVLADSFANLAIGIFRPATTTPYWRWTLFVCVFFTVYGYFSERKARKIFTQKYHTLDMICVHDAIIPTEKEGLVKARIKYVSQSCVTLTGWARNELRNRSALDLIHPDDRIKAEALYNTQYAMHIFGSDEVGKQMDATPPTSYQASIHTGSDVNKQPLDPVVSMGFDDLPINDREEAAAATTATATTAATASSCNVSKRGSSLQFTTTPDAASVGGAVVVDVDVRHCDPDTNRPRLRSSSLTDLAQAVRNHRFSTMARGTGALTRTVGHFVDAGDDDNASDSVGVLSAGEIPLANDALSQQQDNTEPQHVALHVSASAISIDDAVLDITSSKKSSSKLSRYQPASAAADKYVRSENVLDDLPVKCTALKQQTLTTPSKDRKPTQQRQLSPPPQRRQASPVLAVPGAVSYEPANNSRQAHRITLLQRHGGDRSAVGRGVEIRFQHKDGGYVWLEVNRNQTREGIVCVYRDASWKHMADKHTPRAQQRKTPSAVGAVHS